MQVTTDTSTPVKKSRAKVKDAVAAAAQPKKPRSRKKVVAEPIRQPQPDVIAQPSMEELNGMIATAAYFIAAQRNFSPGQELDDWLAAERAVRSQYAV
jgi:hypothetical protein